MKKKLLAVLLAGALVMGSIVAAVPAGAAKKNVYEADLLDNVLPDYPAVLYYGQVTVDPEFIAEVCIRTDAINRTYSIRMEVGGGIYRYSVYLGTIATNEEGNGKARFDLRDYASSIATPNIIGPHFIVFTPGKPFAEFDTSLPVFPPPNTPAPARIVVGMSCTDNVNQFFTVDPSLSNYPRGAALRDGQTIDTGYTLAPGMYTIAEYFLPRYNLASISFNDPSGGSFRGGRTAVVNLAPGETVIVTFVNNLLLP